MRGKRKILIKAAESEKPNITRLVELFTDRYKEKGGYNPESERKSV